MRCQPYAVFSIATRQTGGKLPKAVERGGEKERVRGREREREREGDSLRAKANEPKFSLCASCVYLFRLGCLDPIKWLIVDITKESIVVKSMWRMANCHSSCWCLCL